MKMGTAKGEIFSILQYFFLFKKYKKIYLQLFFQRKSFDLIHFTRTKIQPPRIH